MSGTENLLSRAFHRAPIDDQLAHDSPLAEATRSPQNPIIAISREMGSGGSTIGRLVAAEFGFAYYDRQLIDEVSERLDSDPEHIEQHEGARRDALSDILLSFLDRRHVPDTVYLRSLLRVLHRIAQAGRVVIIGRGAACVIAGALRIRVIAPFDQRVARIGHLRQLDEQEARHTVLEADHAQEAFLRGFFNCDPSDVHLYDLVINTAGLTLEQGAELITTRLRQTWKDEG